MSLPYQKPVRPVETPKVAAGALAGLLGWAAQAVQAREVIPRTGVQGERPETVARFLAEVEECQEQEGTRREAPEGIPRREAPEGILRREALGEQPADSSPAEVVASRRVAPGDRVQAAPGDRVQAAPGDKVQAAPGDKVQAAPGDRVQAAPGDNSNADRTPVVRDVVQTTGYVNPTVASGTVSLAYRKGAIFFTAMANQPA